MEKFVTTRAEYQWDGEKYVLESEEGYWYDGEWAEAKDSPDPPPAPDPREIAQTEAEFNRINQYTPYGSLEFSGPNRTNATLNLNPEIQALFDQQIQSDQTMLGQALERQGMLDSSPIDLSQFGDIQSQIDTSGINFSGPQFQGLPQLSAPNLQGNVDLGVDTSGLPQIPQDVSQFRGDVEQSVFDRGRALLDPVFSDQERALEQRLANQGLPTSGEAYDRDFTRFGRGRNRAFTDLANQAVITGGQEASRALGDVLAARGQGFGEGVTQAGLGLQEANFANQAGLMGLGAEQGIRGQMTGEQLAQSQGQNQASAQNLAMQQQLLQNQNAARAQGLSEAQGVRGNQFNELASLLGLQQVQQPQMQNFFAPGQSNVTGAYGLQQQALQNQYAADAGQSSAMMGGLFGLGAGALSSPWIGNLFGGGAA